MYAMNRLRLASLLVLLPWLASAASAAPGVVAARAERVSFPVAVEALGTARANESIEVRPQVPEVITGLHFEEGQWVAEGDLLVELGSAEALSDVAAARATLADLESQADRSQRLFDGDTLSRSVLDQRIAQRDTARAALRAAETRLGHREIRAPFAGHVGLRHVSLGALVTPETVITTLDDTARIKVDFDVPETALAQLAAGLPVEVVSAAWPDERFVGEVASIDTRIDPVSRTLAVRALLPNEDARLRPGMFLRVSLLRRDATALVVPEQALVPDRSHQFVFVVDDEGRTERRPVTTGRRRAGEVEITAGLAAGEQVVTEGAHKLRAGDRVRLLPGIPPFGGLAR